MVDEASEFSSRSAIVIPENASSVNFTFGFLFVAFTAALIRGHLGAETDAGRLTVDIVVGILSAGTLATWIWSRRHPGRIGISNTEINQWHRGRTRSVRLLRSDGDLFIRFSGGKHPQPYLRVTGSDDALLVSMYDRDEVVRAAIASGWNFIS
ncbi:MAG: hypothetical protein QOG54_422 [Actinomycetota bacterium]|jgi:hypothetical protein|nr:hypothetical protein [Actinomycetota bacterium]